jgi:hypothetical protein
VTRTAVPSVNHLPVLLIDSRDRGDSLALALCAVLAPSATRPDDMVAVADRRVRCHDTLIVTA